MTKCEIGITKVEVDLKDLETLIFSTGVLKHIENSITSYRNDPFVKPHLYYTPAFDNLVRAMNSARRKTADTAVAWDEPLSEYDLSVLESFKEAQGTGHELHTIESKMTLKSIEELVCKGYLEKGQSVHGAIWASSTTPELRPLPFQKARLTKRGVDKLNESKS